MRLRGLVLAVLLACAAACRTAAEGRRSAMEDIERPPLDGAALRVFATGDTRGFLEPCGCEADQLGGVARRATYAQRTRRPGDVWIDLGNHGAGTGDLRRLRRGAMLDAFAKVGYDVLVPGRGEIADGAAFDDAARARGLRVVCANLRGETGALIFPAWTLVELPGGRRAGIVGIAEPAPASHGRTVTPPADALRDACAQLAGRADVVIAATSLELRHALTLARAVPGVALVLAGTTPTPDRAFTTVGGAVVGVAGHLGEYVTRVDFGRELRPALTWRAWLDDRVPDEPASAAIVRGYRAAASALDEKMVDKIVDGHRAAGFAGSHACGECHGEEHEIWAASLHGRAMAILVEKQANRDPDCVPCHLVDLPDPARGAFDPDAMGVGCEACHGGSAAHAADPSVRTPVADSGRSTCVSQCHHPPEVKNFAFDEKWPLIRHGSRPAK